MQRIRSLDLARGFTVLCMPAIHVVMLYSNPGVQQSILGDVLSFIAEGPGAQLFMLLMGVFYKPGRSLQRALLLLLAAYTLNIYKFIIPLMMGWIPQDLLTDLDLSGDDEPAIFFFGLGDILHFAAITQVVLYLIQRLNHYYAWSLALAMVIMFIAPFFWDIQTGNGWVDYILGLFNGHPPHTFFPVMPWIVYPLAGLTLGYYLRRYHTTIVLQVVGITGIICMIISSLLPKTVASADYLSFYRTGPADTLIHLGFVGLWIYMVDWITRKIRHNFFFSLLSFCSRHITIIYGTQWLLIFWCLAITGYQQLGFHFTFYAMFTITLVTLLFTYFFTRSHVHAKDL